ncbi:MAG: carboxypeptidase regulatory-like domain-containing protein [Deltaproteobacteria bacterium]|nr:carboxypeptidase regulatory-like domain-containing protein [Deltaproteobacteria bacterium]
MKKLRIAYRLSVLTPLWVWLLASCLWAAEGQAKIRGLIYISPSGEPEGDLVMRAKEVEVIVLRGESGFEAGLEALRQKRSPTIARQLEAVRRAQQEFMRSTAAPREEREKKGAILRQERAKLAELREAYEKQVDELIGKHTIAKTKTDSEGKFNFGGISVGRYLIYAHFEIVGMAIHYHWLLPVEAQSEKEIEVSLTKLNSTPLFQLF